MSSSSPRAPRVGLVVPALFALVAAVTFIGLGTWQVERRAWKVELIANLERRLTASPVELPPPEGWTELRRADEEFRRVKLKVEFQSGRDALVYTAGTALRPDIKGPGYFVFTPAGTSKGGLVVINRGHVPQPIPPAERYAPPTGEAEVVGVLRWPEAENPFVRAYDAASSTWFVRDPVEMATRNGWGAVAPFYVEMESPQPASGLPRAGPLRPGLRNEHLQYAITWYALAAVVVVMFAAWVIGGRVRRQ